MLLNTPPGMSAIPTKSNRIKGSSMGKRRRHRCRIIRKSVRFATKAAPGSRVYLAGSFNDWDAASLPMADPEETGDFSVKVALLPGRHEYKFVVNGEWVADGSCSRWTVNKHGTLNSVVEVPGKISVLG